ncbi:class I SAM-dependent methyltransferase [Lentiprolixibacter aurantiacus]|uniref:Class I SAM-dependent methyltransferase n=1 Tax=Lentiprolixibacter aurantiacus TaxID=2993939 RepID=A0AAE3SQ14_9FLAO|nr:class I SAM-dependent methyltransferase [Lentiprolixibacter aurantiacus]MCX2720766.1 class I SAM-dependent methyltransferase [Lentiprolixibacter aurantiacus]
MAYTVFEDNLVDYEQWYEDHKMVFESEVRAIQAQFEKLPENIHGIEVGLGTGRFAHALGIREGIEPAEVMAQKAVQRGIEVVKGTAEQLPYADMQFDFVLFVTICYLDNLKLALREANRVLKRDGSIIIGFLDKEMPVAQNYLEKKHRSTFYRDASFYTVKRVESLLKETGFSKPEFNQTLFGELDDIVDAQYPKEGFGEGSFVVVKAIRK